MADTVPPHFPGCYGLGRAHFACALAEIKRLGAEIERLNARAVRHVEALEACQAAVGNGSAGFDAAQEIHAIVERAFEPG